MTQRTDKLLNLIMIMTVILFLRELLQPPVTGPGAPLTGGKAPHSNPLKAAS